MLHAECTYALSRKGASGAVERDTSRQSAKRKTTSESAFDVGGKATLPGNALTRQERQEGRKETRKGTRKGTRNCKEREMKGSKCKRMHLKMLQINSNRSREVHELIWASAIEGKIDLVLISEPNRKKIEGKSNCITDRNADATILITNDSLAIHDQEKGQGWVYLELKEIGIVSIYCSPNEKTRELEKRLAEIAVFMNGKRKPIILGGDLNAKSLSWGGKRTTRRGQIVEEWQEMMNLRLLNIPGATTFKRGDYEEVLDLTFTTMDAIFERIRWNVSETEFLSDHKGIEISLDTEQVEEERKERESGWIFKEEAREELEEEMKKEMEGTEECTPEELEKKIVRVCSRVLKARGGAGRKKAVFWWTKEIAETRRNCLRKRRQISRQGKDARKVEKAKKEYRQEKKRLKNEIIDAKRKCWKELIDDAERNIWGDAFRIVCNKLKRRKTTLPKDRVEEIVEKLFPRHEDFIRERFEEEEVECKDFTMEEMAYCLKRVRIGKAPGPDGLVTEIVKAVIGAVPEKFLKVFNDMMREGKFPENWKKAKLVLIRKPNKDANDVTAYRPVCLLNIIGKLAEHLINERLKIELEESGYISDRQYGFRTGKSTIGAIEHILTETEKACNRPDASRLLPCVVAIDVSNAFNSASWELILEKLKKIGINTYLRRILGSYLEKRKILVSSEEETWERDVNSGVPQGSVLGPTLWNILYNDILDAKLPDGVLSVAYADDLALVATAKTAEDLKIKVDKAIKVIITGMEKLRLKVANNKTEILIIKGRRKIPRQVFSVGEVELANVMALRYLGVWLDEKRSFKEHINRTAIRTSEVANNLARMLPNVGGPSSLKRKLIATVVNSIMSYGIETWYRALGRKTERTRLEGIQRKVALRVISAYRTTSTEAALVLAGVFPIHLVAEERRSMLEGKEPGEAREVTWRKWQEEWDRAGKWTGKVVPKIRVWAERSYGNLGHFATQFFTGHGCFGVYLKRFGIAKTDKCVYCGTIDTPAHTIFTCERWEVHRRELYMETGVLTTGNILNKMMSSRKNWDRVQYFINKVMSEKNKEEKSLRLELEGEEEERTREPEGEREEEEMAEEEGL